MSLPGLVMAAERVTPEVNLVIEEEEVAAFSSRNSTWVSIPLEYDERVLRKATGGNIAVAATGERLLGFSAFTNDWHQQNLEFNERLRSVQVDDNIATVVTDTRVFAFNARTGQWLQEDE